MPIPKVDYIERPFYQPRYTPDTSRLASIVARGGEQLADLSLQRGQTTANTLGRLQSIISQGIGTHRAVKAAQAAVALREQEQAAARAFTGEQNRLEREARKAERDADKTDRVRERTEDKTAAGLVREEEQLEQTIGAAPRGVSPALFQLAQKFPALKARFQVQDGAPVLMRTPAEARQAGVDAEATAERKTDNDRLTDALKETTRHNQAMERKESATGNTPVVVQTPDGPAVLDRRTLTAQPITMAGKQVGPAPSAAERMDSRKFSKAAPVLRGIGELSERINTLNGVIAKASGEAEKQKAKVNLNDDVAEYEALVSMFTPMVARALGHTGVLTEQDVQSVKQGFPKPGDSKSLRDRKMTRLLGIIGELEGTERVDNVAGPAPAGPKILSITPVKK